MKKWHHVEILKNGNIRELYFKLLQMLKVGMLQK